MSARLNFKSTSEVSDEITRLLLQGLRGDAIARQLGVDRRRVWGRTRHLREKGVLPKENRCQNENREIDGWPAELLGVKNPDAVFLRRCPPNAFGDGGTAPRQYGVMPPRPVTHTSAGVVGYG